MNSSKAVMHIYIVTCQGLKIARRKKEEYIFIDIRDAQKWKDKEVEKALFYKPTFKNGCRRK